MRVYHIRKLNDPLSLFVLGVLFIGIGVFFGIILSGRIADMRKRCTESAEGVVISVSEGRDSDDNVEYRYTVQFEVNGKKYENEKKSSSYVNQGEKMTIMYDPDDPDKNYIKGHYVEPKMTRMVGGVFGAVGLIAILVGANKKKRGY